MFNVYQKAISTKTKSIQCTRKVCNKHPFFFFDIWFPNVRANDDFYWNNRCTLQFSFNNNNCEGSGRAHLQPSGSLSMCHVHHPAIKGPMPCTWSSKKCSRQQGGYSDSDSVFVFFFFQDSCSLHLAQDYEHLHTYNFIPTIMSKRSAPGLIIAEGIFISFSLHCSIIDLSFALVWAFYCRIVGYQETSLWAFINQRNNV